MDRRRKRGKQGGRMEYFLQQLINGLTLGAIYGLIAIGYTMVYGIIRMINFAHGEIYMLGAFISLIAFLVATLLGGTSVAAGLIVALVSTMILTALWGWAVERLAYRPLRDAPKLAPLISAIGMSIVLQNFSQLSQGARVKPLPPLFKGGVELLHGETFSVNLSYLQMVIMALTVVLMLVFTWVITRTPLGRAQRATEQDMKMAALLGGGHRRIFHHLLMGAMLAFGRRAMVTLWGDRLLHRLPGRHQGVHRRRAGRHRLVARGDAGRRADRFDRGAVVGLFLHRIQGCGRLLDSGAGAVVPPHRPVGPAGSGEDLTWPARTWSPPCATVSSALVAALATMLGFRLVDPPRR